MTVNYNRDQTTTTTPKTHNNDPTTTTTTPRRNMSLMTKASWESYNQFCLLEDADDDKDDEGYEEIM
eukprot:1408954-Heterocapsa_arctica.AAC.1